MPNQKGVVHILIVIIAVVLIAIAGFFVINSSNNNRIIKTVTNKVFTNLPDCEGKQFTTPIVDINKLDSITPLGNLNPPEHTTPTNHMYFNLNSTGTEIVSPGDITLTSISSSEDSVRGTTDYSIDFSLCDDIHGYFIHIKTLTPELKSLLSEDSCNSYGENNKYKNCWGSVSKKLKAGEKIGTVGTAQHANFDFGAFTNINNKQESLVCPLDIYTDGLRQELYSIVDRTKEPICGEVYQDIEGTLQGDWRYTKAKRNDPEDWNNDLTFGHDNNDPDIATISIGGVFTRYGTYSFFENNSGNINRKFSEVKQDNNIYCFEAADNVKSESPRTDGKILVQLVSETKIEIEHQNGSCGDSEEFASSTIYER